MTTKPKVDVDVNYNQLLGRSWAGVLEPLLKSSYMKDLMSFLHESYKIQNVRPNKKEVFNAFKYTPFTDVRIVIIGKEPYQNFNSTGLAFGNPDKFGQLFEPELLKILNNIEIEIYNGLRMYSDPTLIPWAYQDILLLNSALTVEVGEDGSHLKYWRNFIREVIKTTNEWKTGIIFCLWGEEAQYFKQYINTDKNYVLECEHPSTAVAENRDWFCNHFTEINKIINKVNGKECIIDW